MADTVHVHDSRPPEPPPDRSNTAIIVGVLVVVVVLLLVFVFTRGPQEGRVQTPDVVVPEVQQPQAPQAPQVEVPERIDVDVNVDDNRGP